MILSMTLIAKVTLNGLWNPQDEKDAKISTMEKNQQKSNDLALSHQLAR
jgi:hypothetical protein